MAQDSNLAFDLDNMTEFDDTVRIAEAPTRRHRATKRPGSVLEAFEHIVELVSDSGFNEEFKKNAAPYIRYASRKLKLKEMPVVLMALFVDRSEDSHIRLSEIAKYVGCSTTRILRIKDYVDMLVDTHYLRERNSDRSISYRVPFDVIESIRKNEPYVYHREPLSGTGAYFERFKELLREKNEGEITYERFKNEMMENLREIRDTAFARAIKGLQLCENDTMLFLFMAYLFLENCDDDIRFSDIEDLYDNCRLPGWVRNEFKQHRSELFEKKLIENVYEDGFLSAERFKLTDNAKENVLGEIYVKPESATAKDLLKHDTFVQKTLIYNESERKQVEELSSILSAERFADVQSRLEKLGMRKGFCCLFYGAPGTGKTETVYQIARSTGRDIMRVDVDKLKSCWVGQSEKNIKDLFDRYRRFCANSTLAPILLFNEADAVLGVRMEGATRGVDKMENSIQNIILQEMESLDGIMIATTNLTANLDKAFERRFLYKIMYQKPTTASRAQIWRAMLPAISEEEAEKIAAMFDLSGGEIENIVRKHSVNVILTGNDHVDADSLAAIAQNEKISTSLQRIGF